MMVIMKGAVVMFIDISDIKKSYGAGESRVEVLKGISFGVEKGEFCVLLGPSGSGKSTLLNIIGGIDDADSGYISINGEKIENMKEKALTDYRRRHLGYIFQMYNLIPNLNIKENVETGAYLSDHPLDVDDPGAVRAPSQAAVPAFGRPAAEVLHRQSHREEPGYTAVRRAYRRAGLQHLEGDTEAHRDGEPEVQHHDNHGHSQRSDKGHG